MSASDDDVANHDVSINDRRVKEIFEARREAHRILTQAEKAITTAEHSESDDSKAEQAARRAITEAHGALKAYIIAAEDIIRDGSDEAQQFWGRYPFGRIRFTPGDKSTETPVIDIRGLHGLITLDPIMQHTRIEIDGKESFMRGAERPITERKRIPISVLWKGYRFTTGLLAERGFEIEEIENEEWQI